MVAGYNVRSKVKTLVWYLKRPHLHRELLRRVLAGRFSTPNFWKKNTEAREHGTNWCEQHLCEPRTFFTEVGISADLVPVAVRHPQVWRTAQNEVAACPVKMGGPADVDVLYHLCRYLPAARVIETGVASGWSTLAILLAMKERGEGQLVSVDMPYANMENESFVGCAVPADLRLRWKLLRMADREGLQVALRDLPEIDIAHYDSDKSYAGRSWGYTVLWAALRPGGILVSDDVEDNGAFRDFAVQVHRAPRVFRKHGRNYAGALVK